MLSEVKPADLKKKEKKKLSRGWRHSRCDTTQSQSDGSPAEGALCSHHQKQRQFFPIIKTWHSMHSHLDEAHINPLTRIMKMYDDNNDNADFCLGGQTEHASSSEEPSCRKKCFLSVCATMCGCTRCVTHSACDKTSHEIRQASSSNAWSESAKQPDWDDDDDDNDDDLVKQIPVNSRCAAAIKQQKEATRAAQT